MSILVIDMGTSGVRAAVVRPDTTVSFELHQEVLPDAPAPGLVEFDASAMAQSALEVARAVLADHGPVDAVGIANQRGSTVVWDRAAKKGAKYYHITREWQERGGNVTISADLYK